MKDECEDAHNHRENTNAHKHPEALDDSCACQPHDHVVRLTRNRTPKWGVETPRSWGRVRQGYPQALVSSNWHGGLSPARSLCVRRRVVVKVAAERRLMARKRKPKLKTYSQSGVGNPFSFRKVRLKSF